MLVDVNALDPQLPVASPGRNLVRRMSEVVVAAQKVKDVGLNLGRPRSFMDGVKVSGW